MKITEIILEYFGTGPYSVNDVVFTITQHALDRLEERNVPISTAREMLNRISKIKDTIEQIEIGQQFWVYDESLGISLGMRRLDSGKVQWATSIIGKPYKDEGRHPVVNL